MFIKSLQATNFRNFENLNISFKESTPVNLIISPNGMGKSNFLEMIYFLSYLHSFRNVHDKEIIKKGNDFFFIESSFESNSINNNIKISYKSKKEILYNDKKIKKTSELLGKLVSVLFCNEDIFIISGAPGIKRKFFDVFFSILDEKYLYHLKKYQEIIKQKNFILKDNRKKDLLSVYNQQLTPSISYIQQHRIMQLQKINEVFQEEFAELGFFKEKIKIIYNSSLKCLNESDAEIFNSLEKNKDKEISSGYSLYGIHRDSYLFLINGIVFNKYASLGQMRLASLILKLIQGEFYKKHFNSIPILLLDDVILELDKEKQKNFLNKLSCYKQLFFTFTSRDFSELFKDKELLNEIEVIGGKTKEIR